jgi:hypothetical protein
MQPYLRLRQICLAAPHLEASSALIRALLGVEECHRDPSVAKYGLENALFPIGPDCFLEVVSPTGPGTAAGRFLEQTQGRGGYMLIFDCDDPKARAERAQRLGVRLANHIDRERFQGLPAASQGLPRRLSGVRPQCRWRGCRVGNLAPRGGHRRLALGLRLGELQLQERQPPALLRSEGSDTCQPWPHAVVSPARVAWVVIAIPPIHFVKGEVAQATLPA